MFCSPTPHSAPERTGWAKATAFASPRRTSRPSTAGRPPLSASSLPRLAAPDTGRTGGCATDLPPAAPQPGPTRPHGACAQGGWRCAALGAGCGRDAAQRTVTAESPSGRWRRRRPRPWLSRWRTAALKGPEQEQQAAGSLCSPRSEPWWGCSPAPRRGSPCPRSGAACALPALRPRRSVELCRPRRGPAPPARGAALRRPRSPCRCGAAVRCGRGAVGCAIVRLRLPAAPAAVRPRNGRGLWGRHGARGEGSGRHAASRCPRRGGATPACPAQPRARARRPRPRGASPALGPASVCQGSGSPPAPRSISRPRSLPLFDLYVIKWDQTSESFKDCPASLKHCKVYAHLLSSFWLHLFKIKATLLWNKKGWITDYCSAECE